MRRHRDQPGTAWTTGAAGDVFPLPRFPIRPSRYAGGRCGMTRRDEYANVPPARHSPSRNASECDGYPNGQRSRLRDAVDRVNFATPGNVLSRNGCVRCGGPLYLWRPRFTRDPTICADCRRRRQVDGTRAWRARRKAERLRHSRRRMQCGGAMEGREDRRYCSRACRQRAYRVREKA